MDNRPHNIPLRNSLTRNARGAGGAAIVVGLLVLVGWALDIDLLKSVLEGKIAMKPNTAICFVLMGAALLLLGLVQTPQSLVSTWRRRAAFVCAAVVALIGLASLFEMLSGVDLGIDRLLFRNSLLAEVDPGRMAATSALSFMLLGVTFLLLDAKQKIARVTVDFSAMVTLFLGAIALLGYLYQVEWLYRLVPFTPMALHTAFLFVLLALGVLLARPERGVMRVLTSEHGGGVMARRILVVAILLPVALGWLLVRIEQSSLLGNRLGLALFVATNITLLVIWSWLVARSLNLSEATREQAQVSLQQSQAQIAAVIDSAMDAIISVDGDQRVFLFNDAAEKMFRCTAVEAVGQPIDLFIPPRFRSAHSAGIRTFGETRVTTRTMAAPVSGLRQDGEEFPLEASISQTEVGGQKFYTVIMRDMTEKTRTQLALQASELRYRRLFESAKDGILILDAGTGQIVEVNPFLIEILGYSKDEFVGRELWELGAFKDIVSSKTAFVELQQHGYIRYEDLPLKTKSGLVKQVEFVSNSYLAGQSRVIQCNIRDIGERKLNETRLKEANDRLEQAHEELLTKSNELTAMTQQLWQASKLATMGELAASIAHELNNPLATVALRTENLLMQMPEDPDKRKPLEIISQEVDRMASLVNNLLQFSRRSHRQVSTLDLREEVATSVEFVHYHLRSHNIEVVHDFGDDLPTIQADRQQLRQLFLNLITNASDAMPQGGKLTLRPVATNLGGAPAVAIEVQDTGEGITAENLKKIWEPFFTTKPEGRGTGLGMGICRRIVEEHGGTIEIQSQVGHGTTVRIVLPATPGATS